MDVLARILGGGGLMAGTPGPTDDFWYRDLGASGMSKAGQWVDAESAQKLSAWYRGRNILATVLAMIPFVVYRRLPDDGGAEVATDHPLYDVLHDQPNAWQDSFQWRREKVFNVIDYGWSYDWIVPGARGFVHELHPIHPSLVRPEQIKSGPNRGRYLFHVRDESSGRTTVHTQDEIFYLRGADGKGILEYARTSLGTALATESYAANIFGKGTLNGGWIKVPGVLNDDAGRRMAKSYVTKPGEEHVPKVLEQGAEFTQNNMTPENAQMLLSRKFGIDDQARWLGLPRQMLENSDPSFGNAEQFDDNFFTYSMGGWFSLIEFASNSQLILNRRTFYAEFKRDAVVRAKFSERMAGLVLAAGGPIITKNEARKIENRNRLNDPKYDTLVEQQNITGKPPSSVPASVPAPPRRQPPGDTKAEALMFQSASKLLQKEARAVKDGMVKHGGNDSAWKQWVTEFYVRHPMAVMEALHIGGGHALDYCARQKAFLLENGATVLDQLTTDEYARDVATFALQEAA